MSKYKLVGNRFEEWWWKHNPFTLRFNGYANPKDEPWLQRYLWKRYARKVLKK